MPNDLDMSRARQLGDLFGGNGLPHHKQVILVAEKLEQWRKEDRAHESTLVTSHEQNRSQETHQPTPPVAED